ncbi:MAG: hypothetical protein ROW39_07710 [Anaerolineaceae bacterium]
MNERIIRLFYNHISIVVFSEEIVDNLIIWLVLHPCGLLVGTEEPGALPGGKLCSMDHLMMTGESTL